MDDALHLTSLHIMILWTHIIIQQNTAVKILYAYKERASQWFLLQTHCWSDHQNQSAQLYGNCSGMILGRNETIHVLYMFILKVVCAFQPVLIVLGCTGCLTAVCNVWCRPTWMPRLYQGRASTLYWDQTVNAPTAGPRRSFCSPSHCQELQCSMRSALKSSQSFHPVE
jgi:hypothetical protein